LNLSERALPAITVLIKLGWHAHAQIATQGERARALRASSRYLAVSFLWTTSLLQTVGGNVFWLQCDKVEWCVSVKG